MIRRTITFIITAIYLLALCSIKNINVSCQCGCREFICHCCNKPESSCGVTSYSECHPPVNDESDAQPPATIPCSSGINIILNAVGEALSDTDGSTLPGYPEPPTRPPPHV